MFVIMTTLIVMTVTLSAATVAIAVELVAKVREVEGALFRRRPPARRGLPRRRPPRGNQRRVHAVVISRAPPTLLPLLLTT
jgi:hypothetical protein